MAAPARDPSYWRDRAEEARVLAERLADEGAQETLRQVARCYDRLADRVQRALASPKPPPR